LIFYQPIIRSYLRYITNFYYHQLWRSYAILSANNMLKMSSIGRNAYVRTFA